MWTDGACRGNPGPGGWAAIVVPPGGGAPVELHGGAPHTTNRIADPHGLEERLLVAVLADRDRGRVGGGGDERAARPWSRTSPTGGRGAGRGSPASSSCSQITLPTSRRSSRERGRRADAAGELLRVTRALTADVDRRAERGRSRRRRRARTRGKAGDAGADRDDRGGTRAGSRRLARGAGVRWRRREAPATGAAHRRRSERRHATTGRRDRLGAARRKQPARVCDAVVAVPRAPWPGGSCMEALLPSGSITGGGAPSFSSPLSLGRGVEAGGGRGGWRVLGRRRDDRLLVDRHRLLRRSPRRRTSAAPITSAESTRRMSGHGHPRTRRGARAARRPRCAARAPAAGARCRG